MEKLGNTETDAIAKETFYNQIIPYPIVNDKQDSEILSRQIKNQLRMLEANRNSASFSQSSNLLNYERLKKQNDFINLRMRIERLKKAKAKTQREREQNKKQFLHLVQVSHPKKNETHFLLTIHRIMSPFFFHRKGISKTSTVHAISKSRSNEFTTGSLDHSNAEITVTRENSSKGRNSI